MKLNQTINARSDMPALRKALDAYIDQRIGNIIATSSWNGAQLVSVGAV